MIARGSKSWCSRKCQEDAEVRGGWNIRAYIVRRDRGVCSSCGCDGEKAARVLERLREASAEDAGALLLACWRASRKTIYDALPAMWEADHLIPVSEGGGGCGLSGFRTLCRPCHLDETQVLRVKRESMVE